MLLDYKLWLCYRLIVLEGATVSISHSHHLQAPNREDNEYGFAS